MFEDQERGIAKFQGVLLAKTIGQFYFGLAQHELHLIVIYHPMAYTSRDLYGGDEFQLGNLQPCTLLSFISRKGVFNIFKLFNIPKLNLMF